MARKLKSVKKSLGSFLEDKLNLDSPFSIKVTNFVVPDGGNKYFLTISYNVYRSNVFRKSYKENFLIGEDKYLKIFGEEEI